MFGTANAEIKIYTGTDIYIMSESDNLGSAKEKAKQKALRNIHVHEYEKVDFEEMLKILQSDIPNLKEQLQKILSELE